MEVLKRALAFYVFGNIHVAVAAYCLTKISFIYFDFIDQSFANFIFFSTILSYNFIRYFQLNQINSMLSSWMKANKKSLILLNGLASIGSIYYALKFEFNEILTLLPFLLATVLYVFPFYKGVKGLRSIPGLKLFLIALTWTGLTLYLPMVISSSPISSGIFLLLTQRFLFVLAITIPFDIRDAQFDLPGLNTLPQNFGVNNSKILAVTALLISILMSLLMFSVESIYLWVDFSIIMCSILLIAFSGVNRSRYYTAFWIEALPILWYILYLIFAV